MKNADFDFSFAFLKKNTYFNFEMTQIKCEVQLETRAL